MVTIFKKTNNPEWIIVEYFYNKVSNNKDIDLKNIDIYNIF